MKKIYYSPQITTIVLDNEISLALESTPPAGVGEGAMLTPEQPNSDPFKMNLG
jgi:hypothetical protein